MDFSVVVPTYNRADMIAETLETILNQTHPPREVIVVDDGSTDHTQEILAPYASRVDIVRIPNSGEIVARNTGIRRATGQLVSFCDSDDLWRPDLLASMAAIWQAEPGLKTAYANFVIVRDGVWETAEKFDDAPPGYWDDLRPIGPGLGVFDAPIVHKLIDFQPFFPSAMTVDRAFFQSVGCWDEAVNRMVSCDFATTLRIAEHPPVGVIRTPLVGIRKHGGNFSADVQKMNLGDARVLEMVLAARPSLAPHAQRMRQSMALRRRNGLDTAFARGDYEAVRTVYAMLPVPARSPAVWLKAMVARMPSVLRDPVARMLLLAGSLKGR